MGTVEEMNKTIKGEARLHYAERIMLMSGLIRRAEGKGRC